MKPYGRRVEARCEYCVRGRTAAGEATACRRRAEARGGKGYCFRFCYDPLLRSPRRAQPLSPHDPTEFKL